MKRVLSLLLVLIVLVGMIPVSVEAASTLKITTQPKSMKAPVGNKISTTVVAKGEGLTYQWYYKNADSSTWNKSSVTSATYSATMKEAFVGRSMYCLVKDKNGNSVKSDTISISLGKAAKITKQPKSQKVPLGKDTNLKVEATGDNLSYQWYFKGVKDKKWSKSSITTSEYVVPMKEGFDGRQIYCQVKDEYGNVVKSEVVTLTLGNAAKIVKQPKSTKASVGEDINLKIEATGDGLSYSWYYKGADDSEWTKSEVTTSTYSIPMKSSFDGRQIYCKVKDEYGNVVKSEVVTVTLGSAVKIIIQPESKKVAVGEDINLKIEATGDNLSYQWFYKGVNDSEWTKSSVTESIYSIPMKSSFDGRQIYCQVQDGNGNIVKSDIATISVDNEEKSIAKPKAQAVKVRAAKRVWPKVEEESSVVIEESSEAEGETSVVIEESSEAEEKTSVVIEESSEAEGETSVVIEESSEAEEETSVVIEESSEAEEETSVVIEESSEAEEETSVMIEESSETEEESSVVIEESSETEEEQNSEENTEESEEDSSEESTDGESSAE